MAELTSLSHWLLLQPERVVALQAGGTIATAAFVDRVDSWIATLAARPGQRFALYHNDSSEFLAILLALWQLRRVACIVSDNKPGTVEQMQGRVDGFIGDFPAAAGASTEPSGKPIAAHDRMALDPDFVGLEIYTSGSSGSPKSIPKTIAQLEAELAALETLWPSDPASVVLATVTHQHFYGLVIALLWPFCAGRAFDARLCEFPEDIIYRGVAHARFSLVSSPSHLARFSPAFDWQLLAGRCDHVLSSAAPLKRDDSLAAGELLAAPVREIYGSTETGAIAWRCQQDASSDAPWQALPGVRLAPTAKDTLSVTAAYLGVVDQLELPDRVEFDSQDRFRLLGRVDRIVKVEGKRISLAAIEGLLSGHHWVRELRALTIERARIETAIVMQLSEAGREQLEQAGRKALIRQFRDLLDDRLEPVAIPRRWRFVEQMPFNRQGKLPLRDLQALFDREDKLWPQIVDRQIVDGRLIMHCRIPPGLDYFDGHIDGRPVLPGIVQLHWAEAFARRWLAVSGRFERLEAIKFQKVILPHYEVQISLDFDAASGKLDFCYESKRGVHSRGRICFTC